MRLPTVRRTSFRWRSISNLEIESTIGPRKYDVTCASASAESRFDTNTAEQRILAVPATRQLSGLLSGMPGCAADHPVGIATASARAAAGVRNLIRRYHHRRVTEPA